MGRSAYLVADPARGEVRRPIAVVPEISVLLQHEVEYARAGAGLSEYCVRPPVDGARQVDVALQVPEGLHADTATRHVSLEPFGDAHLYFRVRGVLAEGRHEIKATASLRENAAVRMFALGFVPVEYSHIRPLRFYRSSTVTLQAVNVTYANIKVGYIKGVGDNVMPMLEELGIPVAELDPLTLPQIKLSGFSAIVVGPRAYEANPALVANNGVLMAFAHNGGTIVTQYGQGVRLAPERPAVPALPALPHHRSRDRRDGASARSRSRFAVALAPEQDRRRTANWVQERTAC